MIYKYMVKQGDPTSLGSFLIKKGLSKRAIMNAKNNGGLILVNHKRRFTSYKLAIGDVVHFKLGQEKENKWLHAKNKPIDIVFETDQYLIINKPAGLLSIPSRYEDNDSVVNRVMAYLQQKKDNFSKPHIVTRLDRDTSGLVIIGKNSIAHAKFNQLDKNTDFIKKYHAIVHNKFKPDELDGKIALPIGKIDTSVKRHITNDGKKALTLYHVLNQNGQKSLVDIRLATGRTHQIRVHFAAIGHPLYGDKLYGIEDNFSRQALNCYRLEFVDPFSNKSQIVKITDPEDMQELIKNNKFLD